MILLIPTKHGSTKKTDVDKAPKEIISRCDYKGEKKWIKVSEDFLETQKSIQKSVPKNFFVAIGGDHSITYSLIKGTKRKPFFIMVDAHPDCENGFENPTHEDFVRRLIEEKMVEKVVMVGVREWTDNEREFMKKNNIVYFTSQEIETKGIKKITEDIMALAKKYEIYLSIDMDGVDPAFAPGVDFPEPGGLSAREILYFIGKIKKLKLIGSDIVEFNPKNDINEKTLLLIRRILDCLHNIKTLKPPFSG